MSTAPTLTDDVALEDVLADIPLFSVGFVAFGVFTFFFVMRRLNRITIYIHIAILLAFLASVFDLSQIIRRGAYNTAHNLHVSDVEVLMDLRELSFAFSFGFRFFFFWAFVAEPPRGELPLLPVPDERRPNFITLDSESTLHSGSWVKWASFGFFMKWTLLAMTIAVPVLQSLWRLVDAFDKFGPIYYTEGGIEIVLSAIFVLKLLANTFMSPLTPRWRTLRDYSPPIFALLVGMGVGVGNVLCLKFSESILGRFLQAVELYVLVLFVLLSAFYKMPVRSSVVAELVRRRLAAATSFVGFDGNNGARQSTYTMSQAPTTGAANNGARDSNSNRRSVRSGRPSLTQRISTVSIFSSRLLSRRNSGRQGSGQADVGGEENDQRRLWSQDEAERGESPVDQKGQRQSLEQTPTQTPMTEAREAPGWKDPLFTSIVRVDSNTRDQSGFTPSTTADGQLASEKLSQVPTIVQSPSSSKDGRSRTVPSMAETTSTFLQYERSTTDSPVYGLDGIIRNLQVGSNGIARDSNISSARSSGLESLIRQQQELDKSIADLRSFSPSSNAQSLARIQSGSVQSDFSLSNFPDPPFLARSASPSPSDLAKPVRTNTNSDQSLPVTEPDRSKSLLSEGSLIVDDVTFQLVPPQMPMSLAELPSRSQNLSVPTVARESLDSVLEATGNREGRLDSQGTQYDVTSFIGGYTTMDAGRNSRLTGIIEQERPGSTSDIESEIPATISELTRIQFTDSRRPSEVDTAATQVTEDARSKNAGDAKAESAEASSVGPALSESTAAVVLPPPPSIAPPEPESARTAANQGARLAFAKVRGLPTGTRGRLEISNPIPRDSGVLNERVTFQRPRPAPLVLQNSNDPKAPPAEAPKDGRYF